MAASGKGLISMQNRYDRVIVLVDMDCFYCQVEEKLDPRLRGKPLAVVQYNAWRGGGIIAVNYAARAKGVTRHMRGDEAKEQCPDIVLAKVPSVREKADLTKYREAGKEVANILQRFTPLLERASVDEAYLDITDAVSKRLEELNMGTFLLQPEKLENTFAVGFPYFGEYVAAITARFVNSCVEETESFAQAYDIEQTTPAARHSDLRLLIGGSIAGEIRAAVKAETGYECSAGVAHNKILAKLACGINKPNKQTILPLTQIPALFETLPVGKITGLGGKFGEEVCERLQISFIGQLLKFTELELQKKLDDKSATWLYNICRGIDLELVTPRFYSKSIGCCKKFPGRNNITGLKTLNHWLNELAHEIRERLEKDAIENNRRARQMVVSFVQDVGGKEVSSSRSAQLSSYDQETFARCSLDLIKANTKQFYRAGSDSVLNNAIRFLGISVGKFETINGGQNKLQEMFANQMAKRQTIINDEDVPEINKPTVQEDVPHGIITQRNDDKTQILGKQIESEAKDTRVDNIWNNEDKGPREKSAEELRSKSKSFFLQALMKQKGAAIEIHQAEEPTTTAAMKVTVKDTLLTSSTDLLERCDYSETNLNETSNQKRKRADNSEIVVEVETSSTPITMSTITKDNYETQYVEFATPEFRPELLKFIQCEICSAKLPGDERAIQMHQDQHIAERLSQQQREAYREEIKARFVQHTSKSPAKRVPKRAAIAKSNTKGNIKKFLKVAAPDSSSLNCSDDIQICEICDKAVERCRLQEHSDWHVAKELSKTLNTRSTTPMSPATTTQIRRSLTTNPAKSIAQYFSQQ